jgi:hypothetical protein
MVNPDLVIRRQGSGNLLLRASALRTVRSAVKERKMPSEPRWMMPMASRLKPLVIRDTSCCATSVTSHVTHEFEVVASGFCSDSAMLICLIRRVRKVAIHFSKLEYLEAAH